MDAGIGPTVVASVLDALDLDRAVELVREVCTIPSVLGEEGPLAAFLASTMAASGFEDVELQPVLEDRPNAVGHVSFGGDGPTVVLTGHMDTKPVSHGWKVTEPFSGALIDGAVYGHGVMDMKAALACQIVAMEAVRASGASLAGRLSMAAVADHMGDQLGSIAFFDAFPADMAVLGELTDNQVSGLAVHIGARVAALAQPGEVLVSQTVKDLVTGSGLALTDRGVHELKGVPEAWRVFLVAA